MIRYTMGGDPAVEQVVEHELGLIVEAVVQLASPDLTAILLVGGFGRGAGGSARARFPGDQQGTSRTRRCAPDSEQDVPLLLREAAGDDAGGRAPPPPRRGCGSRLRPRPRRPARTRCRRISAAGSRRGVV